jgi:hypothetical protein
VLLSTGPDAHSLTTASRSKASKGRASKPITAKLKPGSSTGFRVHVGDGLDRLYGKSALVVEIDADVREEYWTEIRKQPDQKNKTHT